MSVLLRLLLVVAAFAVGGNAMAHENQLLQVQVEQLGELLYEVRIKVPSSVGADNQPAVLLPEDCAARSRVLYQCALPLQGRELEIRYAQFNPSVSSLVQVRWLSGERRHQVLAPAQSHWVVPKPETIAGVSVEYFRLGVVHILQGWDHLLFLLCLLLIARDLRRVVLTLSGFTLAHSFTMIAAALGLVRMPVPPVEAVIALSVMFLAGELLRNRRDTLVFRYPVLVAVSFGLVHGFGFAAALAEIGLPQTALVTGLVLFNLGVEAGQLLLALAWFALVSLSHKRLPSDLLRRPVLYMVGTVAAYWFVERSLGAVLPALS